MGETKTEEQQSWKEILVGYTQDSTMHGLRYTTREGKREKLRRFLWVLLVLTATCLFWYLFISRLQHFFKWPKSVNVDVTYSEQLPFPAVTVCNQNQFRLSKIHEKGLYDEFEEKYNNGNKQTAPVSPRDTFELVRTGCLNKNHSVANMTHFREVTLNGCKHLCQTTTYDLTCSVVLFLPLQRSCYLQPVLPLEENGQDCEVVEIHRRRRNEHATFRTMCDFDGSPCALLQDDQNDNTDFLEVTASVVNSMQVDHTSETTRGHLMYLPEKKEAKDIRAEMFTNYSQTKGKCVELFYTITGTGHAKLTLSHRGEDFISKPLVDVTGMTGIWTRMFAHLPNGLNQVVLHGFKPAFKYSGILLDSISIDKCENYEVECMRFFRGQAYTGKLEKTINGGNCRNWTDHYWNFYLNFPDGHIKLARNKCRYPSGIMIIEGYETPFCFDQPKRLSRCDLKYCECKDGYKSCGDGRCLPQRLICDGIADCPDLKDETEHCKKKQSTTCQFLDAYLCGYNASAVVPNGVSWTLETDSSTRFQGAANGGYLVADSGSNEDQSHVYLISPLSNVASDSCFSFLYILSGKYNAEHPYVLMLKVSPVKDPLAGRQIWKDSRNINGQGFEVRHAAITVPPDLRGKVYFVFQGNWEEMEIADIKLENKACPPAEDVVAIACNKGQHQCGSSCIAESELCDGVTNCDDSSDETHTKCKTKVNINCDFGDPYLCGYQTSATIDEFAWTRDAPLEFNKKNASTRITRIGYNCTIPFEYNGTTQQDCVTDSLHPGKPWCSLEEQYNPNVTHWDYCEPEDQKNPSGCGQLFTSLYGTILSPNYPYNYRDVTNCRYEILLPEGVYMEVKLGFVELEEHWDFILIPNEDILSEVYLRTNTFTIENLTSDNTHLKYRHLQLVHESYTTISGYFNTSMPYNLTSATNRFRLYFTSDSSNTYRGFSIEYKGITQQKAFDSILVSGLRTKSDPGATSALLSPEVDIQAKSCLIFDYSIVNELRVLIHPVGSDATAAKTVWTMDKFTGNTWSRAWITLSKGKYHIMWHHQHGLDVKIKSTINRETTNTAMLRDINVKAGSCDIQVQPGLECDFSDINQCGYSDVSKTRNYWSRIERYNEFYMVAELHMDLQLVNMPASLLSRLVTISQSSCLVINVLYFKIINFWWFLEAADGRFVSAGQYMLNSTSENTLTKQTLLQPIPSGTYYLNISITGNGQIYIKDIGLKGAADCSKANNATMNERLASFEKWSILKFLEDPLNEEYLTSFTYTERQTGSSTDNSSSSDNNAGAPFPVIPDLSDFVFPTWNVGNVTYDNNKAPEYHTHDYSKDPAYDLGNTTYGPTSFDNMTKFRMMAGHQKDDFVYYCEWDNKKCNDSKIITVATDAGLCVTFNADPQDVLETGKIGSGFGLKLLLNVEQYEYIKSPNFDAGIKVYLHHQSELSLVRDLGFAVYPGVHALVAAKYSKAESLGPPYGYCGNSTLKYFKDVKYTRPHCEMECITSYCVKKCGCKMAYMPGDMPVCNLTIYLGCIAPMVFYEGMQVSACRDKCLDACKMHSYSADISYAAFRSVNDESIFTGTDFPSKLLHAREIAARVDVDQLDQTLSNIGAITNKLEEIQDIVKLKMENLLKSVTTAMKTFVYFAEEDMRSVSEKLSPYIENFESANGKHLKVLWKSLNRISDACEYYEIIKSPSSEHLTLIKERAKPDFAIVKSIVEFFTIFSNPFSKKTTVTTNKKQKSYKPESYILLSQKDECEKAALFNPLRSLEVTFARNDSTLENIVSSCKRLISAVNAARKCHYYYYDVLEFANETLTTNKAKLKKIIHHLNFDYQPVKQSFNQELKNIENNITWLNQLAKNYSTFNTKKANLVLLIDSVTTSKIIDDINTIITMLNQRVHQEFRTKLTELHNTVKDVYSATMEAMVKMYLYFPKEWEVIAKMFQLWLSPVAELDATQILRKTVLKSEAWRVWPKSKTLLEVNIESDTILEKVISQYTESIIDKVLDTDNELRQVIDDLKQYTRQLILDLSKYGTEIETKGPFLKENFVVMDVYFAVLKYELVQQNPSYGYLNFLSEIGGYMGLLMGCSVLTICEVLDLILHQICLKRVTQHLQMTQVADAEESNKLPEAEEDGLTKVAL